jgi:hypothetical protein
MALASTPGSGPAAVRPLLLSVCTNVNRMEMREHDLASAGYQVLSATTLAAAWAMAKYCNFDLVVLDSDCATDLAALGFHSRFRCVVLGRDTPQTELRRKVSMLLRKRPRSVH